MPALSPTMETGTLSKWLVKVGDAVKSGDVLAEIETDKATMEVESINEGVVTELVVDAGAEGVPVGQVIMRLRGEGEAEGAAPAPVTAPVPVPVVATAPKVAPVAAQIPLTPALPVGEKQGRVAASPLARRVAELQGVDLAGVAGSGPNGRIVRADVDAAVGKPDAAKMALVAAETPPPTLPQQGGERKAVPLPVSEIPHEVSKLGAVRKIIAKRLTEAKATIPHIYLTVDVQLDALLKLRGELNAALEPRKIKLSVNDMVIKALALALGQVPKCNVSFAGDTLISYSRADI
ncbi:MAG: 2-oxo acid dehydrogenase subunit E2, partial [Sandarakinorhabdus sp.]|nr:2-oxo acid dehydrogenase subunit E2 [Sandarakinorhabdus sp.]